MRNCLTYAVTMWIKHGGYLMMRKSRFYESFGKISRWHPAHLVPHFLHRSREHVVTQYTLTEEQRQHTKLWPLWRKWLHLWNFDGQITGDDKADQ